MRTRPIILNDRDYSASSVSALSPSPTIYVAPSGILVRGLAAWCRPGMAFVRLKVET